MAAKYIVIRRNPLGLRPGTWLLGEAPGEPLYRAELRRNQGRWMLKRTLQIYEFSHLAPYIVEQGFQIPMGMLPSETPRVKEIEDWQSHTADIVEPEMLKRQQAADPSFRSRNGIVVPDQASNSTDRSKSSDNNDSGGSSGS